MSKYEVTTENGVYEVDTEDALDQAKADQQTALNNTKPLALAGETVKRSGHYIAEQAGKVGQSYINSALHPIQTVKNTANLLGGLEQQNPLSIGGRILKNLPGADYRDNLAKDTARSAVEHPVDFATDSALTLGAGKLLGMTNSAVPYQKIASRINNSLIKPVSKDLLYGNPGEGIAKEGLIGKNFEDLSNKVTDRTNELVNNINQTLSASGKNNVKINLNQDEVLKPLTDIKKKLLKFPTVNQEAISRIDNITKDIGNGKRFGVLTPEEAVQLKRDVGELPDWQALGDRNRSINVAIKQVYHNIDNAIDNEIPETKLLNKRITDMIAAKKAISHRQTAVERSNLLGLSPRMAGLTGGLLLGHVPGGAAGYLGGVALEKIAGSTPVKTGMASFMSKKYSKPILPRK